MKVAVGLRRVAAGKRTSGRRAAQIAGIAVFIFFRQNLIIYNLLKKVYILQRDIMAISMNIHIII